MSIFFKPPIDIEISLEGEESRKHIEIASDGQLNPKSLNELIPLYGSEETISGVATLRVREGRKVEHLGIKVSVIGSIDLMKAVASESNAGSANSNFKSVDARKKSVEQFLCFSYDLAPVGELQHSQSFPFMFKNLSKRYESYCGENVDVSYYVKVTLMRKNADISKIKKFWVYLYPQDEVANGAVSVSDVERAKQVENSGTASGKQTNTDENAVKETKKPNKPIKLDIGIENCLHIEFEYAKSQYSLKDVIVGRIYFLLTRLKIKHMELSLITRESAGLQPSNTLTDTLAIRYEIMDGSPVKGETIPIRLFLSGYDLIPNMNCNYFNIKNYLSLVIIDEDGRRYFKQSEIKLFRAK